METYYKSHDIFNQFHPGRYLYGYNTPSLNMHFIVHINGIGEIEHVENIRKTKCDQFISEQYNNCSKEEFVEMLIRVFEYLKPYPITPKQ